MRSIQNLYLSVGPMPVHVGTDKNLVKDYIMSCDERFKFKIENIFLFVNGAAK